MSFGAVTALRSHGPASAPGRDPRPGRDNGAVQVHPRQDPYWLLQPDSGRVYLDGEEVRLARCRTHARTDRTVFQDLALVTS